MSIYESIKKALANQPKSEPESEPEPEQSFTEDKKSGSNLKSPWFWIMGIGGFLIARSLFSGSKDPTTTVSGRMLLTKNFRVGEFLRSASIPELKEYQLTEKELTNLRRLATVLQSFRDDIGAPIIITSGGRPPNLRATHGKYAGMNFVEILKAKNYSPAEFSQHMDFSAADFTTENKEWLVRIMEATTNVYYSSALGKTITQIILYIENGVPDFIHLGVHSDIHDFERITANNRLLLAMVTSSEKMKKTEFLSFTKEKMNELIGV